MDTKNNNNADKVGKEKTKTRKNRGNQSSFGNLHVSKEPSTSLMGLFRHSSNIPFTLYLMC